MAYDPQRHQTRRRAGATEPSPVDSLLSETAQAKSANAGSVTTPADSPLSETEQTLTPAADPAPATDLTSASADDPQPPSTDDPISAADSVTQSDKPASWSDRLLNSGGASAVLKALVTLLLLGWLLRRFKHRRRS